MNDDPRPELAWIDAPIEDVRQLRFTAIGAGFSVAEANGLSGAIAGGANFDELSKTTAAKYRKMLRDVGPPPSKTPTHAGTGAPRKSAAKRGARKMAAVVGTIGLVGTGLFGATSHQPAGNGSLAASQRPAPIIPERQDEELQEAA